MGLRDVRAIPVLVENFQPRHVVRSTDKYAVYSAASHESRHLLLDKVGKQRVDATSFCKTLGLGGISSRLDEELISTIDRLDLGCVGRLPVKPKVKLTSWPWPSHISSHTAA
jgi:hypothetical protein